MGWELGLVWKTDIMVGILQFLMCLGPGFLVFLVLSILACFLSPFDFDDFFGLFFKFDKIETA